LRDELSESSAVSIPPLEPGQAASDVAVWRVWPAQPDPAPALVVSRTVPIAADHTGRPARLTHHVVLSGDEITPATVAALLLDRECFVNAFHGPPRTVAARRAPVPPESMRAHLLQGMARATVDGEAWARHLGIESCKPRGEPACLVLPDGSELLLCAAAIALHAPRAGAVRLTVAAKGPVTGASVAVVRTRPTDHSGDLIDWSRCRNDRPCPPPTPAPAPVRPSSVPAPVGAGDPAPSPRQTSHGGRDIPPEPPPLRPVAPSTKRHPSEAGRHGERLPDRHAAAATRPPAPPRRISRALFAAVALGAAAVAGLLTVILLR